MRKSKYKPEFCELLIAHMEGGLTFSSFAGVAEISRSTLNRWVASYEEFAEAKDIARAKAEVFWMKKGLDMINGTTKGSAATWIFCMKNIFGWADKFEGPKVNPRPINIKFIRRAPHLIASDADENLLLS